MGVDGGRALGDDLAAIANYLRRISMLQTELGAFASLATLRCPRGRARWNVLREGLSALECHLHADQVILTARLSSQKFSLFYPAFIGVGCWTLMLLLLIVLYFPSA